MLIVGSVRPLDDPASRRGRRRPRSGRDDPGLGGRAGRRGRGSDLARGARRPARTRGDRPSACSAGPRSGFGAVCLPFFLSAPTEFIRYVFIDQLARPNLGVSLVSRLRALEGLSISTTATPSSSIRPLSASRSWAPGRSCWSRDACPRHGSGARWSSWRRRTCSSRRTSTRTTRRGSRRQQRSCSGRPRALVIDSVQRYEAASAC